jgi:hypothetical protein
LLAFAAGAVSFRPRQRAAWAVVALLACGWLALVHKATDELDPLVYVKSAKAFPHLPREQVLERRSDSLSSVEIFKGSPKTLWSLRMTTAWFRKKTPSIRRNLHRNSWNGVRPGPTKHQTQPGSRFVAS